jgi:acetyl esterase/lipase
VAAAAGKVDLVVDLVGGDTGVRSLPALKPGGLLVVVPGMDEATKVAAAVAGVQATWMLVEPDHTGLAALAELVDTGQLRVLVDTVFPHAEAAKAHELGESGRTTGKIVLWIADGAVGGPVGPSRGRTTIQLGVAMQRTILDIPLWPGRQFPAMRVVFPESPDVGRARPAVLVFQGGAYATCAGSGGGSAEWIAEQAMVGVRVEYRTQNTGDAYPANYADAARAVRLVRERSGDWNSIPNASAFSGIRPAATSPRCSAPNRSGTWIRRTTSPIGSPPGRTSSSSDIR